MTHRRNHGRPPSLLALATATIALGCALDSNDDLLGDNEDARTISFDFSDEALEALAKFQITTVEPRGPQVDLFDASGTVRGSMLIRPDGTFVGHLDDAEIETFVGDSLSFGQACNGVTVEIRYGDEFVSEELELLQPCGDARAVASIVRAAADFEEPLADARRPAKSLTSRSEALPLLPDCVDIVDSGCWDWDEVLGCTEWAVCTVEDCGWFATFKGCMVQI